MEKEQLRPVEWRKMNVNRVIGYASNYTAEVESIPTHITINGWFHKFETLKDDDGSEVTNALVELADGKIERWPVLEMRFTDREYKK